ncbi:MAG: hypothetical protein WAU34_00810, partial [Desulfobacterales bacterium]
MRIEWQLSLGEGGSDGSAEKQIFGHGSMVQIALRIVYFDTFGGGLRVLILKLTPHFEDLQAQALMDSWIKGRGEAQPQDIGKETALLKGFDLPVQVGKRHLIRFVSVALREG